MPKLPMTLEECHQIICLLRAELVKLADLNKAQQLEIAELKERLDNNSSNSSLPPSQDFKKKKKTNHRKPSGKKSGGQVGHKGHYRELLPVSTVDSIKECALPKHCFCGGEIAHTRGFMRHQVHELPQIKLHVTEYQLQKGCCTACHKHHIASLPEGISWGMTGPRFTAFMLHCVTRYRLSRRELQDFVSTQFNFKMTVATVFNKEKLMNSAMEEPVSYLLPAIKQDHAVHTDETGHKHNGKKHWVWGMISSAAAYFTIQTSRGKKILRNLLGDFKHIVITDRYAVYNLFGSHQRQICWAHLIRDFTKLSEKRDTIASRIGKQLLKNQHDLFELWYDYKSGKIPRYLLKQRIPPIRRQVGELLEQGSYTDPSLRITRFCKNLLNCFNALWTFIEMEGVEPTNNHAERYLRPLVIWRKNYFTTRSNTGKELVARSASIHTTCKLQNKCSFHYLSQLIHYYFSGKPAPPLITNLT